MGRTKAVPDYLQARLVIEMKTIIAKADLKNEELFRQAAQILKTGGLVAFPTETVYGLGGDALNPKASEKNIQCERQTI